VTTRGYVVGTAVDLVPRVPIAVYLFAPMREPDLWGVLLAAPTPGPVVLCLRARAARIIILLVWTPRSVRRAAAA